MIFWNHIRNQEKKLNRVRTKNQNFIFFLGMIYTLNIIQWRKAFFYFISVKHAEWYSQMLPMRVKKDDGIYCWHLGSARFRILIYSVSLIKLSKNIWSEKKVSKLLFSLTFRKGNRVNKTVDYPWIDCINLIQWRIKRNYTGGIWFKLN